MKSALPLLAFLFIPLVTHADIPICYNPNTGKARLVAKCNAKEQRQMLVTAGADAPAPGGSLPVWAVRKELTVKAGTAAQETIVGPACSPKGTIGMSSIEVRQPAGTERWVRCDRAVPWRFADLPGYSYGTPEYDPERVDLNCFQGSGYDDQGRLLYLPVPEDKQVLITLLCLGE